MNSIMSQCPIARKVRILLVSQLQKSYFNNQKKKSQKTFKTSMRMNQNNLKVINSKINFKTQNFVRI